MSKIGRQLIQIPEGVQVKLDGDLIVVKGSKGELKKKFAGDELKFEINGNQATVSPLSDSIKARALWGTWRMHVCNMIEGVSKGFEKKLELEGVGFKASVQGKNLGMSLGFSHPVNIEAPEGIAFKVEKNVITVSGIDKELVGQTAANIRDWYPPEPYKGKGIRYSGEVVRRKAGKKVGGTTA